MVAPVLTANHVAMHIFVRNIESKLDTISEPKVKIRHFREKDYVRSQ